MQGVDELSATIRELYSIVNQLEIAYRDQGRHFTLDGHLIGSIGEVYAAERYGIKLFKSSHEKHDGETKDGRLVQVKATQTNKVGISSEPKYLVVLHINSEGEFEEVYNGPGRKPWMACGKLQKNGQRYISLSKLSKMNGSVKPNDRV